MPNARKIGDQYSVLVYMGKDEIGKKVYKRISGYNKDDVECEATALKRANKKRKINGKKQTVKEILDNYIKSKNNIMSPSTIRGYSSLREHHYQKLLDLYIEDLSIIDIQNMVNEEALNHTPKTVRNIYGLLTAAVNEYCPEFSFKGVKLPSKVKTNIQIPDDNMVIDCLNKTKGTDLHTAILLAAYMGLRRSEICALTRKDIDFKRKTLNINKAVVLDKDYNSVTKSPKSYAGSRIITIPDFVFEELKKIESDKLVNMTVTEVTNSFGYTVRKLGYNFRFHDLRHYNASIMLMLNIPNKYAQERIGHATDNMLKTVYQHTVNEKQKEISDQLNTYFDSKINEDNKKDNKKDDND